MASDSLSPAASLVPGDTVGEVTSPYCRPKCIGAFPYRSRWLKIQVESVTAEKA